MVYTILDMEKMPEALKNKPRWLTCLVLTTGLLMITVSAISIGVFIGYTYCYIEHQNGITAGNITQSTNFQILHLPVMETEDVKNKRTINGALASSVLVNKILKMGRALLEEEANKPCSDKTPNKF